MDLRHDDSLATAPSSELPSRAHGPAREGRHPTSGAPSLLAWRGPKRLLVGSPLRTSQLSDTLLPKRLAMPVFCSDPLSSVAYATEEILLVLGLGGVALLHLSWYVAAAIVVLLAVVVASYRQTCHAYPNGGGAYTVASANLADDDVRGGHTMPSR